MDCVIITIENSYDKQTKDKMSKTEKLADNIIEILNKAKRRENKIK